MAKTHKYVKFEETPKKEESAAHKNRRDSKQLTRTYTHYIDEYATTEDALAMFEDDELFETFERIKKR